jgi:hypothetical protein
MKTATEPSRIYRFYTCPGCGRRRKMKEGLFRRGFNTYVNTDNRALYCRHCATFQVQDKDDFGEPSAFWHRENRKGYVRLVRCDRCAVKRRYREDTDSSKRGRTIRVPRPKLGDGVYVFADGTVHVDLACMVNGLPSVSPPAGYVPAVSPGETVSRPASAPPRNVSHAPRRNPSGPNEALKGPSGDDAVTRPTVPYGGGVSAGNVSPRACEWCRETFAPARKDARFCSSACKLRAHRARHAAGLFANGPGLALASHPGSHAAQVPKCPVRGLHRVLACPGRPCERTITASALPWPHSHPSAIRMPERQAARKAPDNPLSCRSAP